MRGVQSMTDNEHRDRSRIPFGIGTVGAALDGAAWRPSHTRIALVLGLGWMLDAFEANIVGNVLGVLQRLWRLTASEASLIVSAWLVGIMVGALFLVASRIVLGGGASSS